MSESTNPEADIKPENLASDGRTVEDFADLEARRIELADQYGKRKFSRATVGAVLGVPGSTIMRIERVTPRTTAAELEQVENALNQLVEAYDLEEPEEAEDSED